MVPEIQALQRIDAILSNVRVPRNEHGIIQVCVEKVRTALLTPKQTVIEPEITSPVLEGD